MLNFKSIISMFAISPARFGVVMLILSGVYPVAYVAMKEITGVDPFGLWVALAGIVPFLVMTAPFALLVSFKRTVTRLFMPVGVLAVLSLINMVAA